jgi:transposase-like protein
MDVWLSRRGDRVAARAFFKQALCAGTVPVEVTTDRAAAYPRVLDDLILPRRIPRSSMRTTRSRPIMVD